MIDFPNILNGSIQNSKSDLIKGVNYGFGDINELNKVMIGLDKSRGVKILYGDVNRVKKFPLIWLNDGYKVSRLSTYEYLISNVNIVFSCNAKFEDLNKTKYQTTMKSLIDLSGDFVNTIGNQWLYFEDRFGYEFEFFTNFQVNENKDFWDAIRMSTSFKVNINCIKNLNYVKC